MLVDEGAEGQGKANDGHEDTAHIPYLSKYDVDQAHQDDHDGRAGDDSRIHLSEALGQLLQHLDVGPTEHIQPESE